MKLPEKNRTSASSIEGILALARPRPAQRAASHEQSGAMGKCRGLKRVQEETGEL
jgi:hypothetical protein